MNTEEMNTEEMLALTSGQLTAYNERNLETFCSYYHDEVEVFSFPSATPSLVDIEKFKELYRGIFEQSPNLHCEIKNRIVTSKTVIEEEMVTGHRRSPNQPLHVVAVYTFAAGKIRQVWFG
jgi:hypothetical protein